MKRRDDGRIVRRITLPSGKKKDVYARTKAEMESKIKEITQQVDAGVVLDDHTTVGVWSKCWFDTYKRSKRDNTKAVYRNAYNVHIAPYIGEMELKDVKEIHIKDVMNRLNTWTIKNKKGEVIKQGISSESLQEKVLRTMKQIFQTAVQNHLIMYSPCEGISITKRQKPDKIKFLTEEQQTELLTAVKDTRAELITAIGLYCGLRREESIALKWSDVNYEEKTLNVNRSITFKSNQPIITDELKSDAAHRTIPIPEPLMIILDKYNPNRSGTTTLILKHKKKDDETVIIPYIIHDTKGRALSETAFRRMWEVIENGVSFEITSHMLRHTYCTTLHKSGVDLRMAQYLMGHSDIRMTTQIYTHIEKKQIEAAAQKIKGLFDSQSKVSQSEAAGSASPVK